jgi:hypothetical protein
MQRWIRTAAIAVLALAVGSCSSDLNKSSSPILLVASNTQTLSRVDLAGGTGCNTSIATVHIQAIQKNSNAPTSTFNQVRLTSYTVSYARTDGGKLVPAAFSRAMDSLVDVDASATDVTGFQAFETGALDAAPFAALLPQNGGRDPDTGLPVVHMNLTLDIFGQTLAGEKVSARTLVPLEFCYNCGGCS